MEKRELRAAIVLDERLDDLYSRPPEEFVGARNALVKDLKGEQRVSEADAIKKLKRPTVAANALNQLVRRDHAAVDGLVAAVESLRDAQAKAMSGPNASLRDAMRTFTDAVDTVAGRAATANDEISAALRIGASDTEWWDEFRQGRVSRLPESSGADMWSAGAEPTAPKVRAKPKRDPKLEAAQRRLDQAASSVKAAADERDALEVRLEAAEERLREAQQALDEALREVDELGG